MFEQKAKDSKDKDIKEDAEVKSNTTGLKRDDFKSVIFKIIN